MVRVNVSDWPVVLRQRMVTEEKPDRSLFPQGERTELNPPLFSSETVPAQVMVLRP